MTTVTLDAADAVELTEILEYLIERLHTVAHHDLATPVFNLCSRYDIDELRQHVARLIDLLNTRQIEP
jgi:hypothetical protein